MYAEKPTYPLGIFQIDTNIPNGYVGFMEPNELKNLRKKMGISQKDLAAVLKIPYKTYQNWEQPEGKTNHRKIPEEFVERIKVLSDLKAKTSGSAVPRDLFWLQIPLRQDELKDLQFRAELAEKTVVELLREKMFEILQSPITP